MGLQRVLLADIDECGYDQLHMSLFSSDPLSNCPLFKTVMPRTNIILSHPTDLALIDKFSI